MEKDTAASSVMSPLGKALMDYQAAGKSEPLRIVRQDGTIDEYSVVGFFATSLDSEIERTALEMCRGRVLDVGAGAGRHSLLLQTRGISVDAIDVVPEAVEVMCQRGVRQVRCVDVWDLRDNSYDTILMLSHGLGLAATLEGLNRFLHHMKDIVTPDGAILADSLDVRKMSDAADLAYQASLEARGKYRGEMAMRLEYGQMIGNRFGWLHVDFETLSDVAAEAGWTAECLVEAASGSYLCRLSRRST